jgi:penicillin-binding protein 2
LDLYLDELRPEFRGSYRQLREQLLASRGYTNSGPPTLWSRLASKFNRKPATRWIHPNETIWLERQARYSVVSNVIAQVNAHLGTEIEKTEIEFHKHYQEKTALPFTLAENLTQGEVARLIEQGWALPGLELELLPVRRYPNGKLAAHLIGHLRRDDSFDEEERTFNYRFRDYRGGIGLEAAYDRELRGRAGAKSILINSAGYRHRAGEMMLAEPEPGHKLHTTLDIGLQSAGERALASVDPDVRGAAVVMDPHSGDVLAMASLPSFDPNQWINGVTHEEYEELLDPVFRPMVNRASYEIYAPGSIFKIVTALALMDSGILHDGNVDESSFQVRKLYTLGNRNIRDTAEPGLYNFHRAFIRSSNGYFIDYALKLGLPGLLAMGQEFQLGQRTGIGLREDSRGVFPSYDKIAAHWNRNNLADVAIGQQIAVTPLQMAVMVSAVANGGRVLQPRLVTRIEPAEPWMGGEIKDYPGHQVRRVLTLNPAHVAKVQEAMRADVASPDGTGRSARVAGFDICGKTGTAEVKQGTRLVDLITWFVSYAPYDNPRYAVVVMVESGRSGGLTCAPVARKIYEYLKEQESLPTLSSVRFPREDGVLHP